MKRALPFVVAVLVSCFAFSAKAQLQPCIQQTSQKTIAASSYTVSTTDYCWLITMTAAGNMTVTLPAPGLIFPPGYTTTILPLSATATITFVGAPDDAGKMHQINGQTTLALGAGAGAVLRVAQDYNWYAVASGPVNATQSYGLPLFNVISYGAKCDATDAYGTAGTDDTAAINAAAAALRAVGHGIIYGPPDRYCYHTGTINLTNFTGAVAPGSKGRRIEVSLHLMCAVGASGTCVDALDTRYAGWPDFELLTPHRDNCMNGGDDALVGVQFGRSATVTPSAGSENTFFAPNVVGCFKAVAWANYAAEGNQVFGGVITNNSISAGSSNVWVDCANHHGILTSAFMTVTWVPDTYTPCTDVGFHGANIQKGPSTNLIATAPGVGATLTFAAVPTSIVAGDILQVQSGTGHATVLPTDTKVVSTTATTIITNQPDVSGISIGDQIGVSSPDPAIWVTGVTRFNCDDGGYVSTRSQFAITMFEQAAQPSRFPNISCHIESYPNIVADILVSGTVANPMISGMVRHEQAEQAQFAVVVPDFANGVNAVSLDKLDFKLESGGPSTVFREFGVYQKVDISSPPTVATGGSGCTNGSQNFLIVGGQGQPATVTGTVTGGALGGPLTIADTSPGAADTGSYRVTPGATASTAGGGCSVQPTINLAYANRNVQRPISTASGMEILVGLLGTAPTIDNGLLRIDGTGSGSFIRLQGNNIGEPELPTDSGQAVCINSTNLHRLCNNIVGRNLLLNGAFDIDQANEGAAVTLPNAGTIEEGPDGWNGVNNSTAVTGTTTLQRVTGAFAGAAYALKYTIGTGGTIGNGDSGRMYTAVASGSAMTTLQWGTANAVGLEVSGNAQCSVAGAYSVSLQNAGNARSFVHQVNISTANANTPFSFSVAGDTGGTWTSQPFIYMQFNVYAGSTLQTSTLDAWQAGNFIAPTTQTQLSATTGATCQITNMKLEAGATATKFIHDDPAVLLAKAQTRYIKTFPPGIAPVQNVGSVAGAVCTKNPIANGDPSVFWQFPQPLVGTPTITTFNPSAGNAKWRDVTAAADVTASIDPASALAASTGVLLATGGTVATLADILCIHAVADAHLQ